MKIKEQTTLTHHEYQRGHLVAHPSYGSERFEQRPTLRHQQIVLNVINYIN